MARIPARRISREELSRLYIDEGLSSNRIADLLSWPQSTVKWWLRKYEIPRRSNSEASSLRRPTPESNRKRSETHKALGSRPPVQTKDRISDAHREKLRENAARARANITAESRRKQSATRKAGGFVPHNKGKKWTPEERARHMATRVTPEHREKLAAAQRGEKGHNWKGGVASRSPDGWEWRRLRRQVYERDNWTCRDCGCKCLNTRDSKTQPKRKIQCHHIIRRRDGGGDTLDNLVTLCMSCHHRRERRYDDALFA